MKPLSQEIFNQYRENVIIETVQAISHSALGSAIAFKGGTALKLFFELPRFSEDLDYDGMPGTDPQALIAGFKFLAQKQRWEITDAAVKRQTVLVELRFALPQRNFRLKVEMSTRKNDLKTGLLSLRGVPVITLEPKVLMTEKIIAFLDRRAGRDVFDAWFILKQGFALDRDLIDAHFKGYRPMLEAVAGALETTNPRQILQDTGKLLTLDYRNWIASGFLEDFRRLVRGKIETELRVAGAGDQVAGTEDG